ncbi:MAG: hypothetical protein ACTSRG_17570 [Candidatus Helarchaeota archaeon]
MSKFDIIFDLILAILLTSSLFFTGISLILIPGAIGIFFDAPYLMSNDYRLFEIIIGIIFIIIGFFSISYLNDKLKEWKLRNKYRKVLDKPKKN